MLLNIRAGQALGALSLFVLVGAGGALCYHLTLGQWASHPPKASVPAPANSHSVPSASAKATAAVSAAQAHLQKGEHDQAISAYSSAIEAEPHQPRHYAGRGDAYSAKGVFELAIADYTTALARVPTGSGTLSSSPPKQEHNRLMIQIGKGVGKRTMLFYVPSLPPRPKNSPEAILNLSTQKSPPNRTMTITDILDQAKPNLLEERRLERADYHSRRANAHFGQGNFSEAIADCDASLQLCNSSTVALFVRGQTFLARGEYSKAIDDLSAAIKLQATNPDFYVQRARARFEFAGLCRIVGRPEMAENSVNQGFSDLDEAIRIDRLDWEAYAYRGMFHQFRGKDQEATADLEAAIGLAPNEPSAHLAWAGRLAIDNEAKQLQEIERVITWSPGFARAYIVRGIVYARMDRLDDALADFSKAIKLAPPEYRPEVYFWRALVQMDARNLEAAIADINAFIGFRPKCFFGYWIRSAFHEGQGKLDAAVNDLSECIRFEPDSEALLVARAKILCRNKSFDNAIVDCNAVLKLNPKCEHAFRIRGLAYEGKGNQEQARKDRAVADRLRPEVPIGLSVRKGASVEELFLLIHNESDEQLTVHLAVDNAYGVRRREQVITLQSKQRLEAGSWDGRKFESGDVLVITHSDFREKRWRIPE